MKRMFTAALTAVTAVSVLPFAPALAQEANSNDFACVTTQQVPGFTAGPSAKIEDKLDWFGRVSVPGMKLHSGSKQFSSVMLESQNGVILGNENYASLAKITDQSVEPRAFDTQKPDNDALVVAKSQFAASYVAKGNQLKEAKNAWLAYYYAPWGFTDSRIVALTDDASNNNDIALIRRMDDGSAAYLEIIEAGKSTTYAPKKQIELPSHDNLDAPIYWGKPTAEGYGQDFYALSDGSWIWAYDRFAQGEKTPNIVHLQIVGDKVTAKAITEMNGLTAGSRSIENALHLSVNDDHIAVFNQADGADQRVGLFTYSDGTFTDVTPAAIEEDLAGVVAVTHNKATGNAVVVDNHGCLSEFSKASPALVRSSKVFGGMQYLNEFNRRILVQKGNLYVTLTDGFTDATASTTNNAVIQTANVI